MKLLGSPTSPYVRKVRIVMAEKKLDYQFAVEDVWGSDAILKSNPLGKVPCLIMEGGEAVFDSRVIVEYVDTLSPVGRLIPAGTGLQKYRNVAVEATEEAKAERYPNRIFTDDAAFSEGDLSFVDFDAFSSDDFTPGNYS